MWKGFGEANSLTFAKGETYKIKKARATLHKPATHKPTLNRPEVNTRVMTPSDPTLNTNLHTHVCARTYSSSH